MSPKMLVEWLDCDHEGVLNALSSFKSSTAWDDFMGQGIYNAHTLKSSKMVSLILRMLL